MTRPEFAKEITVLAEVFETELTEARLEIYWQVLKHRSIDQIKQSVHRILTSKTFNKFPLPSEFLDTLDTESQALFAIQDLEKAIRDHGGYASVTFQDPILGEIVNTFDGGWIGLCEATIEQLIWIKKDFIKLYKAKLSTGNYGNNPVSFMGSIEASGNNNIKPVLIGGDPLKEIER